MNEFDGALTTTGQTPTNQLQTTGNIQYWPYTQPYCCPWTTYYLPAPTQPQECASDIHVFPCPHCDKCKCGAATVKRQKAKK